MEKKIYIKCQICKNPITEEVTPHICRINLSQMSIGTELKFRLTVHKMKCIECDSIFMVEKSRWCTVSELRCPVHGCNEGVDYMGEITIVQEN